ncbi:MAG: protease pro-enzyme activation domain-containing protein, partial [Candidatus Tumulicola sp.]
MRRSSRLIASTVGLALTLTACGGQNASLPGLVSSNRVSTESSVRTSTPDKPLISIPKLYGDLAYTDAGKRRGNETVRVSLTLRYNNQAELDAFVANAAAMGGVNRRFLTAAQFNDRYAPTMAQEERVVRALERAGFTITTRFPNRTIVGATARTSVVERFFSTEIHTVRQGKHGERYTNVTPATLPAEIAPLVRDVSLNNLVVVKTVAEQNGVETQRTAPQFQRDGNGRTIVPLAGGVGPNDSNGNLANGSFETGSLTPGWINESTQSSYVSVTTARAEQGSYSAFMGSLQPPEINGWASIAQLVTVPANGVLSFWVYQGSNEGTKGYGTKYAWQAAYLLNQSGSILDTFYKTVNNTNGWVNYQVNLSRWAGQTDYIYFGSYGDGYSQTYVYQYVDNVAWVGSPTPTPSPTPTAKPTATPT